MARTFEYVLHFVRCDTVTVSPNQIIIIIINNNMISPAKHSLIRLKVVVVVVVDCLTMHQHDWCSWKAQLEAGRSE